jgi:L-rhamnose mutarotase
MALKRKGDIWERITPEILSVGISEYVVYDVADFEADVKEIAVAAPANDRWLTIWAESLEQVTNFEKCNQRMQPPFNGR